MTVSNFSPKMMNISATIKLNASAMVGVPAVWESLHRRLTTELGKKGRVVESPVRALMRLNQSWVFFRELTGEGPVGALGVPVRGRATVAADPAFVPLGAPVWLDVDRSEADGLWIAQDTGGAIKGANRFDTFWGAGQEARTIAGGMSARGRALLLLPKGTLQRLRAR